MNSKYLFLAALILLSACEQVDLNKLSTDDINKVIVCNDPYIRHAAGCCLDQNDNGICDEDERANQARAEVTPEPEPSGEQQDVAPVEIVMFADFECPFCARFWTETYPQISEEYIDGDQVKLVLKDFPLSFHTRGKPSAIAAECVQEIAGDEAYFDYADVLFAKQNSLSDDNLESYAADLGVDLSDWRRCQELPETIEEVEEDMDYGLSLGVSGTPTLFINGAKMVGAQPYSEFQHVIEKLLS